MFKGLPIGGASVAFVYKLIGKTLVAMATVDAAVVSIREGEDTDVDSCGTDTALTPATVTTPACVDVVALHDTGVVICVGITDTV